MGTRNKTIGTPPVPEQDTDVAFTGWDPYIVAITGGRAEGPDAALHGGLQGPGPETRELGVMAWLRDHRSEQ